MIRAPSPFLAAALVATLLGGCYHTLVVTSATPGPTVEDRQWFLLSGLVSLSAPVGKECSSVAFAESEIGVVDFLISAGLTIVGGIVGAAVCPLPDNATSGESREYGACVSGVASFGAFIFGTRTVRYACAAGPPRPPAYPSPYPQAAAPR